MRHSRISTILLIALTVALISGDAFARSGGGFSSSRGFSGGSRGFSAPSTRSYRAPSVSKGFSAPAPSRRTYDAPKAVRPAFHATPPAEPKSVNKPSIPFDSAAQRARAEEESRALFRKSQSTQQRPPAQAQPSRTGERPSIFNTTQPRPAAIPRTRTIIVERQVTSGGGIDSNFWLWLMLANNQSHRDEWIYNNRDRLNDEQMRELRQRDANIDARLREIENRGIARNPDYRIPESELRPVEVPQASQVQAASGGHSSFWLWMGGLILFLAFIYMFFFHKFPTRRTT